MRSRVMPGSSVTIERRVPVRRLKSVDLPTLGRPTITIDGSFSVIEPFEGMRCACSPLLHPTLYRTRHRWHKGGERIPPKTLAGCGKSPIGCHSERSEESLLTRDKGLREILRAKSALRMTAFTFFRSLLGF